MSRHLCLLLLPFAALAEDAFVLDCADTAAWSKRPDWLGAPADQPTLEARDGVLSFSVDQADRGMKWVRELDVDDLDMFPWLVVRYRVSGFDAPPGQMDYVLYVGDSKRGSDGLRLLKGDRVKLDGLWHTAAFSLSDEGAVPPLRQLAVGCYAGPGGHAKVELGALAVSETPPAGAEGLQPPGPPGRDYPVAVDDPAAWAAQPSWLGNHGEDSRLEKTGDGVRFVVPTPGTGAKWSRGLAEPIRGVGWVSLRYRANGCAAGGDYALYLAISPGGQALEEQFAVTRDQIVSDGRWQVAIARVSVSAVQTIAVQVQSAAPNASLELSRLTFHETRPPVTAEDLLPPDDGYQGPQRSGQPVALPPGNLDGAGLARLMGSSGWTARGTVSVGGVPFALREGADLVRMTPVRELGSIEVPLQGRGAELYLLLAARLPSPDEPSYGGQTTRTVRHVDRFVARVEYADGPADEQLPVALAAGIPQISGGVGAYGVLLDPARELKRLVLRDGMRRGAFGLLAATLGDKATLPAEATAPLVVPPPRKSGSVRTGIARARGHVVLTSGTLRLDLDTSKGLRVAAARNLTFPGAPLQIAPGPLFHVQAGERNVSSEEFTTAAVRAGEGTVSIELRHAGFDPPLLITVTADLAEPGEIGLRAKLGGGGLSNTAAHLFFPELNGVAFGNAEDTWYFMPRRGAVANRVPIRFREAYCGEMMPLQVIDAFDPGKGSGLYLLTEDMNAAPRYYLVEKSAAGVRLAVEYHPIAEGETPRTVLGCHQGDWHAALDRYRRWTATWYEPAAPRKDWFRRVFSFRQQFINFAFPAPTGYFDQESKTFHFAEALKVDQDAFGGVDYLHLFDWGWDPVHGRCGDYAPWDHLGGADNLRRAVEQTRAAGTPVGLYIEGYLVDPESDLGKAKGKDWELRNAAGEAYPYYAPTFNICPAITAWQDYLAATYARARRETGAIGFYIDEYGFSAPHHSCYRIDHGHSVPATPVLGERGMLQKVRAALGPDAAIYTEESPSDVNSQWQDGSFTYAISSVNDTWSPTHLNLYRFAFPSFKTIEIIICDQPLGSNVEAVKRVLFNGEAIWLEGTPDRWFSPEVREQIARNHAAMQANADCFAGDHPAPLVATLRARLYANRFATRADEGGRTCWTLYNTEFRTVRGEQIAVKHVPGAVYRDELAGRVIPAKVRGDRDVLALEIGPRDVAVVSRRVP